MGGVCFAISITSSCASAPDAQSEPEPSFDDVFNLVIETERHGVLIDAALNGAIAAAMAAPSEERSDIYRVDYALRSGVRDLLALRDGLCIDGIEPDTTCTEIELPDWTMSPPNVEGTPFSEYQARSEWLSATMQPYIAAGCRAGAAATRDEMFCAVE